MHKPDLGMWRLNDAAGKMLAGRPEREAVLEFLQAAYALDYLTQAEHERRAGLALDARDYRTLGELMQDLPYSIELPLPRQPVPVAVPVPVRRRLLDMQLSEVARATAEAVMYLALGAIAAFAVLAVVMTVAAMVGHS